MGMTAKERRTRRAWATSLYMGGATYRHIAETCGYAGPGNAHRDIGNALAEILDQADTSAGEMRRVLLARLERLTLAAWPVAMEGDTQSIRTISRLIGQQMVLYGLNDPKRLDEQVSQDHDAELERLLGYMLESERLRLEAEREALAAERAALAAAGATVPAPRRSRPRAKRP